MCTLETFSLYYTASISLGSTVYYGIYYKDIDFEIYENVLQLTYG